MVGGCKILSLGDKCNCPLCLADKLRDANEQIEKQKEIENNFTSDGDLRIVTDHSLTRDMFFNKLTIVGDAKINPNGFRIYLKELIFEKEQK